MSSATTSTRINALLKKSSHHDKDERFMATSDLIAELESTDATLDQNLQTAVSKVVLTQLDDGSTDVQTVAVKALAVLVRRISLDQLNTAVDKLIVLLVDPAKHESHDLYAIGLKTLITSVSDDHSAALATRICNGLVSGLQQNVPSQQQAAAQSNTSLGIDMAILDVLRDLLSREGSNLIDQHQLIIDQITIRLESPVDNIRKRSIQVIGVLATHLQDKQFNPLMTLLINKINSAADSNTSKNSKDIGSARLYTYLQAISTLCQSAGSRVGKYLNKLLPPLQRFCHSPTTVVASTTDDGAYDMMIELWENVLQAFETILLRCPTEATPYVNDILNIAIEFSSFDPNYTHEGDGENDVEMNGETEAADDAWGDDADDWGDEGGNSLDNDVESDDNSWQLRRSAVRVISAFIRTKTDSLSSQYDRLMDVLISRFNERDSNVKLAVLACTSQLVKESVVTQSSSGSGVVGSSSTSGTGMDIEQPTLSPNGSAGAPPPLVRQRSIYASLDKRAPIIIKGAVKQYSTFKVDVKVASLSLLRDILLVRHGFGSELAEIVPLLQHSVTHNSDQRQLSEALTLLRYIVELHTPTQLQPHFEAITVSVVSSVSASYLKIKADALRTCGSVANALPTGQNAQLVRQLYAAVDQQLQLKDVDSEVKDASLFAASVLLSRFGDILSDQFPSAVQILQQRLQNDLTRLATLRAITRIAQSPYAAPLATLLDTAATQFTAYLKRDAQTVRQEIVRTLTALLHSPAVNSKVSQQTLSTLLCESIPYISPTDLHLSYLIVSLIASVLAVHRRITADEINQVINQLLIMLQSPMLQQNAVKEIARVFQQIVVLSTQNRQLQKAGVNFTTLQQRLLSITSPTTPLSSITALGISHCIASMATVVSQQDVDSTVDQYVQLLQQANTPVPHKQVALFVIGQIGAQRDLHQHPNVHQTIYTLLSAEQDSIRSAAAYSLGNLSTGNLSHYVPLLLQLMQQHPDRRFLLLGAMKELIHRFSSDPSQHAAFRPYMQVVAPQVFDAATSTEESVRNSVSECLGGLCIIDTAMVLPQLAQFATSKNASVRAVAVTAMRYSLGPNPSDASLQLLRQHLPTFLTLLSDSDIHVRKQALLMINVIAHSHPELLLDRMQTSVLPALYKDCKPDPSLIRVVDLGPFKHKEDLHLTIRISVFEAIVTLLDHCASQIDLPELFTQIAVGVEDHDNIATHAYTIITKLSQQHGPEVLPVVNKLPPHIMKGVKDRLREAKGADASTNANTTEGSAQATAAEKAKDVLRAAVRAIVAVHHIPDISTATQWCEFYQRVMKTALLAQMMAEM